jgi:hypothetical protein
VGKPQPVPSAGKVGRRAAGGEADLAIIGWGINAADVFIVSSSVIFIGND